MGWNSVWIGIWHNGNCLFIFATLTGIIADRWLNAEKLYGILHMCYAA
jgi:hypothetical protein